MCYGQRHPITCKYKTIVLQTWHKLHIELVLYFALIQNVKLSVHDFVILLYAQQHNFMTLFKGLLINHMYGRL